MMCCIVEEEDDAEELGPDFLQGVSVLKILLIDVVFQLSQKKVCIIGFVVAVFQNSWLGNRL